MKRKFFCPKRPPQKTTQHMVQNNIGKDGEETPKKRPFFTKKRPK
jgi:hypothetical protein